MKNKGITMIALVVTIIMIVILASVSIHMLIGENGLIKQVKTVEDYQKNAEISDLEYLNGIMQYTEEVIKDLLPEIQEVKTISKTNGITLEVIAKQAQEYVCSYKKERRSRLYSFSIAKG